jgi:hypothetical protein
MLTEAEGGEHAVDRRTVQSLLSTMVGDPRLCANKAVGRH